MELRLAGDQVGEALLARLAEVLDDAVDELRVADLVLHLRGQRELPLERRRRRIHSRSGSTPISSELPCISMNLIELRPVLVRHPVVDLDLAAALHVLEEVLLRHSRPPTERSLAYGP